MNYFELQGVDMKFQRMQTHNQLDDNLSTFQFRICDKYETFFVFIMLINDNNNDTEHTHTQCMRISSWEN